MKRLGLKKRLIISFLGAGLIPILVVGIYSYLKSSSSMREQVQSKLVATAKVKGNQVEAYFETIKNQMLTFSDNVMIRDAMKGFSSSFKRFNEENSFSESDFKKFDKSLNRFYVNEFGAKYQSENAEGINPGSLLSPLSKLSRSLQYFYNSNNENPLGSKDGLDFADDLSSYSKYHAKYHPSIRKYLNKFGYYDIFLVDINSGDIVYSVYKELDYATSLLTGPYQNTNFAEAFRQAKALTVPDSYVIVDYKQYVPSYNAPASFIASPIWENDEKIGVAVFQMPIDRLNTIMASRDGLGQTGETFLVGSDGLMRSDSLHDPENYSVVSSFKNKNTVKSRAIEMALNGESGAILENNYLGERTVTAFEKINILGKSWALLAEQTTHEAFAVVRSTTNAVFIISILAAILITMFAIYFSNSLANKIENIANKLFETSVDVAKSSDDMSYSSTRLSEASTEQASSLQETVSSIDEISSMIQRNADAASNSTQVSEKSTDTATRGRGTVAAMIESISDISESNDEIAKEMNHNNEEVAKIIQVISEIGEKTKVINDIVFQTKLLSFNASVEAARAGEHGKGFAVVAEEVGNLASMSGKAAEEITSMLYKSTKQVEDIVATSKSKVEKLVSTSKSKVEHGTKVAEDCGEALDEILGNVKSVNDLVREIATASAEQSTGVIEVNKAMQQLDQTTHQNTTVAQETSSMAQKVKQQSLDLRGAVNELLSVISGKQDESSHSSNNNQDNGNLLNFQNKEEKHHAPQKSEVKIASGQNVSPSDDMFEDL